ncbi:MAG: ABC transporter ATP-binding protein [Halorientalis sp.]
MSSRDAIEVENVTKRYGSVTALDDVSLSVTRGETFGLIGTNGAGKSTLFRLLIGHVTPDTGQLRVEGQPVSTAGPKIRTEVSYLPERVGFPDHLTAREVLHFHARMRGISEREARIETVLGHVGLTDAADRKVSGFSKGMRRRLGLATALLPRPDILLLDEPTAGLDPLGIAAFHRVISDIQAETELTVVFSSHVLPEAETLCDRVGILHDGQVVTTGRPGDIRDGEVTTIRVRLAGQSGEDRLRSLLTAHDAEVTATRGVTAVVDCPAESVPDVLETLLEDGGVEGYEVQDASLKRAFLEQVLSEEYDDTEQMPPDRQRGEN